MAKTMFDLLEGALEDLLEDNFKRFTSKLTDSGQEQRVVRSAVEGKDRGDIARLLIEQFTENGALKLTLQILRNIKANQTADNLEKEAAANGFLPSAGSGGSTGTATPNPNPGGSSGAVTPSNDTSKAAFIDAKWVELVRRATAMEAILDELLSKKVINNGQYNEFCSERTQGMKMRRLYNEALRACGDSGKAILYDVLMVEQPFMMKDLGAS